MHPPCVTPSISTPNLAPLPEATQAFTQASVAAVVLVPKQDTWRESGLHPGPPMCMKLNGKGFWSPGWCSSLLKSIVSAASLGGVPVFSLPKLKPASDRVCARVPAAAAATASAVSVREAEEEDEEVEASAVLSDLSCKPLVS